MVDDMKNVHDVKNERYTFTEPEYRAPEAWTVHIMKTQADVTTWKPYCTVSTSLPEDVLITVVYM